MKKITRRKSNIHYFLTKPFLDKNATTTKMYLFALFIFFSSISFSQEAVITGWDASGTSSSGDEVAFVLLRDFVAGEKLYITEDEYDNSSGVFNSTEGHLTWTAPGGGLLEGTIITVNETSSDIYTAGGGGGTVTGVGSWSMVNGDEIYLYSASNSASPWNSVTEIHCFVWFATPIFLASQDPSGDYPNAVIIDFTIGGSGAMNADFKVPNRTNTTVSDMVNGANWNQSPSTTNITFNTTSFTNQMIYVPPATAPSVSTTVASSIANTSATLAGNVSADGGATVTERGIVYSITSTNSNPLIGGGGVTKDTNGTGTGVFSESITGLAAGTSYSFNAYAINSAGTSYGSVNTFTTTGKGWTGATNTDWATASNWSPNSVPIASDNLIIPNVTNKPIISASTGAVANDITIDASSSLTVNSGGSLIIDGAATVNGDFIYKVNVADTNWHLVSSPVSGEQFDDTWNTANSINTNLPNEAVASYISTSDADGDWVYFQNGGGATTFGSGTGYSLQRTGAGDYTFTGTFPAPPINPAISASNIGNANENRWTLVGNPFPAHVNIATFLAANGTPLTDTHESVYVWNAGASAYQPLTTGHIHPGQGFFVNSNVASTSVTFTKAMQSDQNGVTFYRDSNPKITIMINDGSKTKSTEINYLDGKTTHLDPRFDIGTFTGQSSEFNIYTHLVSNSEGVNFMRQSLPNDNYENMIIPIGVSASAGKEVTFTTDNMNLPSDIKVFIEDRETNTFTRLDLANTNYTVNLTENLNGIGRFYLYTTQSALSVDKETVLENVSIYKLDNTTVRIAGLLKDNTSFKLFNILGKQVLNTSFTSNGVKDISLPKLAKGVYVVKLQSKKGKLNKKIILE